MAQKRRTRTKNTKKKKSTPAGFAYVTTSGDISEYTLKKNNLRVLLRKDPSAPVVTLMVTYHVGSRNEAAGYTGATHILEHLLFKGTKRFPNPDKLITSWGARMNATTWFDRTNYYETVPKEHLETAIDFEADRMRNTGFTKKDVETEMPVVRNELEFRVENEPLEFLDQHVWATAFQAHPYHHPTIGWRSDIENIDIQRLQEFHKTFYWPNNATVTVIGDIDEAQTLALVKKYFGKIPASSHIIPSVYTQEAPQKGPRFVEVKKQAQTNVVGVAHKAPHGLHEDMYALQIISRVLCGGKSGRLYRTMVDEGLATDILILDMPFRDPGLFAVYAMLTPGTSHEHVRDIICDTLSDIAARGITKEELNRAIAGVEANIAYSRDGSHKIADELNEAIAVGDWQYYTTLKKRIAFVSQKDIKRVAGTYLTENSRTTGFFRALSANPPAGGGGGGRAKKQPQKRAFGMCAYAPESREAQATTGGNSGIHLRKRTKTDEPVGGLTLSSFRTGVRDVVTLKGSVLGGSMHTPENPMVAVLATRMISEDTKRRSREEIRKVLEDVGASLSYNSQNYRIGFEGKCLKKDLKTVISILGEQLRTPAIQKKRFEAERKQLIAELTEEQDDTKQEGKRAFLQAIYPKEHPNHQPSAKEMIACAQKVTLDEVRAFARTLGLGNMHVVATGDVPHDELTRLLKNAFTGWRKTRHVVIAPEAEPRSEPKKHVLAYIPDKGTTDFYIGHAVRISRDHPDYHALLAGISVLGDRSFIGRLMQVVRVKNGLTYGAYTSYEGMDDNATGYWLGWAMFAPSVLEKGTEVMQKEIKRFIRRGVTKQELDVIKQIIAGRMKVGFETSGGVAGALLMVREQGLPLSYLEKYPEIIGSLTVAEVNRAIRAHLSPNRLTIAIAGSVS